VLLPSIFLIDSIFYLLFNNFAWFYQEQEQKHSFFGCKQIGNHMIENNKHITLKNFVRNSFSLLSVYLRRYNTARVLLVGHKSLFAPGSRLPQFSSSYASVESRKSSN